MKTYKLINITDKEHNIKTEALEHYTEKHPELTGYIYDLDVKQSLYFRWVDGGLLITSMVEKYTVNKSDVLEVVTANSIYTFHKQE